MKSRSRTMMFLSVVVVTWLCAVGIGLRIILEYENTAGSGGTASSDWPAGSAIRRSSNLPTLIMMVHPKCPCSRASISELEILMTEGYGRVTTRVLFVKPDEFTDDWAQTDLWRSASIIPGVEVSLDEDGHEARRFGSKTSGQVMLYSTDGDLLFRGGITASRGHTGESAGRRAILSLLNDGVPLQHTTSVFGCPLFTSKTNIQSGDSCHADNCK